MKERTIEHLVELMQSLVQPSVSPAEINSFAFSREIVISHMVSRKKSLESQFLELVKQEEQ